MAWRLGNAAQAFLREMRDDSMGQGDNHNGSDVRDCNNIFTLVSKLMTKQCEDCKKMFYHLEGNRWCEECLEIGLQKDMNEHFENTIKTEMEEIKMSKFRELVGIAIGEASMCWSETPSGVFDSERASAIVDRIVAEFEKNEMRLNTLKNDYWFIENLIEKYSSNKDETLKDILERVKFRKPFWKESGE